MNSVEERFLRALRQNSVRRTLPRKTVFSVLQTAAEPLSLRQMIARAKTADRASVYRTLALFERLGIVNVMLVGWKKRFELATPYKSHHHHIHCEHCGKTASIASPSLEKLIKSIAEQKGFYLHHHTLELSGYCDTCKKHFNRAGAHAR